MDDVQLLDPERAVRELAALSMVFAASVVRVQCALDADGFPEPTDASARHHRHWYWSVVWESASALERTR